MTNQEKIDILTEVKIRLQTSEYICNCLDEMGVGSRHMLEELRLSHALALCRGWQGSAYHPHPDIGYSSYSYWKVQLCDSAIELIRKEEAEDYSLHLTGLLI